LSECALIAIKKQYGTGRGPVIFIEVQTLHIHAKILQAVKEHWMMHGLLKWEIKDGPNRQRNEVELIGKFWYAPICKPQARID